MQDDKLINVSQAVIRGGLIYSVEFHEEDNYVHVKRVNTDGTADFFRLAASGEGGGSDAPNDINHTPVTGDYTITATDHHIGVDNANPTTITLPAASVGTVEFIITDEGGNATTHPITIQGTVSGTVNPVLDVNYTSVSIYSNGTNYYFK